MCSDVFTLQACVSIFDAHLEGVESFFFLLVGLLLELWLW